MYDGVKATGPGKLDIMPVGAGDLLAKRQRDASGVFLCAKMSQDYKFSHPRCDKS